MNEKNNKKIESYKKMILRQTEQIEFLKSQVERLKLELIEKDELINSVAPLRDELKQNVSEVKEYKEQYKELVNELKKMKEVMNQNVFKGRWKMVQFLIK